MSHEFDDRVFAIHCLRVNLASLVFESRRNRRESQRCGAQYRCLMTGHRIGALRRELRLTNLALAFVRQRPYRQVECNAKTPVPFDALFAKISRRLGVSRDAVKQWICS